MNTVKKIFYRDTEADVLSAAFIEDNFAILAGVPKPLFAETLPCVENCCSCLLSSCANEKVTSTSTNNMTTRFRSDKYDFINGLITAAI